MPQHTHNPFSGAGLERRPEAREQPDWREQALADAGTRFLLAAGTTHLVAGDASSAAIAWLAGDHPLVRASPPEEWVLLGWHRGERTVLVESAPAPGELPAGTRLEELRPLLHALHEDEAAVLACARALLVWRMRHRHCGACGATTRARSAGMVLACTRPACGAEYFPRIDPAVIVLVADGRRALLGRQAQWPAGRYSCLAGFVEPGESIEDAVIREVREETGAQASDVRYHGSQPWPFPSSLMLGFMARATAGPVRLDGELEDARWLTLDELAAGAVGLPPRHTIARRLIEAWALEAGGAPLRPAP